VVAATAEHYPFTRRLAIAALRQLHGKRTGHALIWHSRQAELAGHDPVEVVVLFDERRYTTRRGSWRLFGPGAFSRYDGPGRLLVDEVAETSTP
jgi:hypothetical protein